MTIAELVAAELVWAKKNRNLAYMAVSLLNGFNPKSLRIYSRRGARGRCGGSIKSGVCLVLAHSVSFHSAG